jgi:diguanylate cyclase (GGDEF)-like protein
MRSRTPRAFHALYPSGRASAAAIGQGPAAAADAFLILLVGSWPGFGVTVLSLRVPHGRWRVPGDAVVTAQIALTVLVVGWLAAGGAPTMVLARVSWLGTVGCACVVLAAARGIVRMLPREDPARRFWWALCGTAFVNGSGNVIQFACTLRGPVDTRTLLGTPILSTFSGVSTAIVVVAMCAYPLGIRPSLRACYWLDLATVMVAAAAFGWFWSTRLGPAGTDLLGSLLTLVSGQVVTLVAVYAVARLLIAGRAPFAMWAGLLGAASSAMGAVDGALGPALFAHGQGGWFFAISTFSDALMVIAARVQRIQVRRDPRSLQRGRRRPYSVLPYLALAATFGLLLVSMIRNGLDDRTWVVFAGAAGMTGLVVVRQLASFADNRRLLAELDTNVAGLHDALRERDLLAERLSQMAFEDHLTGLANRAKFDDRLTRALADPGRVGRLAVLLLDLDDFKPINDRYGHSAGDAVLQAVAARLRGCVREADLVARLGGDEFAVVLADQLDGVAVAEGIGRAVCEPYAFNGAQLTISVSIGIAYDRGGRCDVHQLLREADAAMYLAKRDGKDRCTMVGQPNGRAAQVASLSGRAPT